MQGRGAGGGTLIVQPQPLTAPLRHRLQRRRVGVVGKRSGRSGGSGGREVRGGHGRTEGVSELEGRQGGSLRGCICRQQVRICGPCPCVDPGVSATSASQDHSGVCPPVLVHTLVWHPPSHRARVSTSGCATPAGIPPRWAVWGPCAYASGVSAHSGYTRHPCGAVHRGVNPTIRSGGEYAESSRSSSAAKAGNHPSTPNTLWCGGNHGGPYHHTPPPGFR